MATLNRSSIAAPINRCDERLQIEGVGQTRALPIDTVFVWLTPAIVRDYDRRGVFLDLRPTSPTCVVRGANSEHRISPAVALALLEDAKVQKATSDVRGARFAYRSLVQMLDYQIECSNERRAMADSLGAICQRDHGWTEVWAGTRQQLIDKGIVFDKNSRKAKCKDWRDFDVEVTAYSSHWPEYYKAHIVIPMDKRRAAPQDRKKEAEHARRSLATMVANPDDFREKFIEGVRNWLGVAIETLTAVGPLCRTKQHGYSFSEESLDEIRMSFDAFVEATLRAEVRFDPALHAKIAEGHRAVIAADDDTFQAHIAELVRSAPTLLKGKAQ